MADFRGGPLRLFLLLAAVGPGPARADTPAAPPPARVHYHLDGLAPLGISQYSVSARGAQREYIHFQNAQGNHYLIYEESPTSAPTQAIQHFRQVMGHWDMACSMDLDCKEAAFCTGKCRNLYYETSNTPEDLGLLSRNHCVLTSYHCEKPNGSRVYP